MRRRVLIGSKADQEAIICLYDRQANKLIFVTTNDVSNYSTLSYVPVGVVVVPAEHDVYGDGTCAIMSVIGMNCSTPSVGSTTEQAMCIGSNPAEMTLFNRVNNYGTMKGDVQTTLQGVVSATSNISCCLSSDKGFTGKDDPKCNGLKYYSPNSSDYSGHDFYYGPCPYLTDGSRNPDYYETDTNKNGSPYNPFSDFNGRGNTKTMVDTRGPKDYNTWKPIGPSTTADYPAASCCDMFFTEGTKQGDWYMPACGELGYILPKFRIIYDAMVATRQHFGNTVCQELNPNGTYWSSTFSGSLAAYSLNNTRGEISSITTFTAAASVRAFMRL